MPKSTPIDLDEVIDISKVESLLAELKAAASQSDSIELNAGKVKRIDTAGMQLLYSFQHTINQRQGDVKILHASDEFKRCMRLIGFENALAIH